MITLENVGRVALSGVAVTCGIVGSTARRPTLLGGAQFGPDPMGLNPTILSLSYAYTW